MKYSTARITVLSFKYIGMDRCLQERKCEAKPSLDITGPPLLQGGSGKEKKKERRKRKKKKEREKEKEKNETKGKKRKEKKGKEKEKK